jgi:hypothetical protein
MAKGGYMAKGGMSQGDDKEDERLAIEFAKGQSKYIITYDDGDDISRVWVYARNREDAQEQAFEEYSDIKEIISVEKMMAKGGEVGQMSVAKSYWNKFDKKQRIDFLVGAGYSKSEANDMSVKKWDSLDEDAHDGLRAVLLADGGMMAKGGGVVSRYRLTFMNDDGEKKYMTTDAYNKADAMKVGKWWEKYPDYHISKGNYKVVSVVELEELEDEDIQDKSYYKIRNDRRRKKERDLKSKEELMEFMTEKGIEKVTFKNNPVSVKPYKKGGKLSTKAKYIPKRDIEEVEVDQNGKEKMIDGADLLDGIYVKKKALAKKAPAKKKPTKKASGGAVKPKSNRGGNVGQIVKLAKEIRKDGEKWTDAVKRASAQLKK